VFCDKTSVTLEHVWPDWVRRNLFPDVKPVHHTAAVDDEPIREWIAPPATLKAKIVCETCNGGWMSDIEKRVSLLLTPMARGESVKLLADDQLWISRWALKTGLIFNYVMKPEEGVNPDFCHGFYERREGAFPATYVWLISCDPRVAATNYRSRNLWPAEVGITGQAQGFVSAIRLHGCILLAYMHTLAERKVTHTNPYYLRTILPSYGIVTWPLRRNLPIEAFPELTEAFIGQVPED
jgi:hypothetical protein